MADLKRDAFEQAIGGLIAKSRDVGEIQSYFAILHFQKYRNTGNIKEINAAVEKAQFALQATPEEHLEIPARLNNLGVMLESRYKRTGEMRDLEEAIRVAELAMKSTPEDHPDRAPWLISLGNKLGCRYEQTGEMRDLEEAIRVAQLVVQSTPENYPGRAAWLNNLGNKLSRRYEQTGEIRDLEEAIRVAQLALESTLEDNPDRAACLSSLGNMLGRRYKRMGEMRDLVEAIRLAELAVQSTPEDYPDQTDRATRLNYLGSKLEIRYERTGDMRDLEEAIRVAELAVKSTPEDHPIQIAYLNNLGNKLSHRYERTGEMRNLEEAIRVAQLALESTLEDHPDRAGILNNLGNRLGRRYERTGEIRDLEEAIRLAELAVQSTPEDHPDRADRAARLSNLGNKFEIRYERTGVMRDLEEAIQVAQLALQSIPEDHPDRAGWLNNLGIRLSRRFERTREMQDLEEAIRVAQLAVQLTPEDHPDRAAWLSNLGSELGSRYRQTGEMRDLEEAIRAAELAVRSTPEDHPYRAACLNSLGNDLGRRYERTREMRDLEEAIRETELAVQSTPEDHPERAAYLINLGIRLDRRYERTGEMRDLDEACSYLLQAWRCQTAIPFRRVKAAALALNLLSKQGKFDTAAKIAKDVIDLLPVISSRSLDRKDRQFVITMFSGVAADACALLLECQEPDQALQYLEKGRTVILSQLMDDRSDISKLKEQHPDSALTYESLRDEVNAPLRDLDDLKRMNTLEQRRAALEELDLCIQEIRRLPGCNRFLLGQTAAEMQACAAEGSIVVVNATEIRSDAIIISSTAIKTLRLSEFAASDVKRWLRKKWASGRSERGKRNREYLQYLSWLWDACVKQVLEEISTTPRSSAEDLPRVWWIGTGLASSVPFHAAGIHSLDSTENALCRVISSYTPSIRALAHSKDCMGSIGVAPGKLLIATMTTTPGLKNLPGVTEEKDSVTQATNGFLTIEKLDQPTVSQVTECLKQCSIAHFACHGYTDHADPSSSGLVFQNSEESKPPKQDILTVHDISEVNTKQARIAYLSACSTAENRVARLADEVIHVVSGFQVAGFPHVIGCLWPSVDRVCVEVARGFYSSLFRQGGVRWGNREVARALRDAVMDVRASDLKQPLNWAQFVHYGA